MKLEGPARALLGRDAAGDGVDLTVPPGTTVGELLRGLADRWGSRFREAVESGGPELPARVRVFIEGEQASSAGQPLAANDDAALAVRVVILAPMMGGAG